MHLVTGHAGSPHIRSRDWAGLNVGLATTVNVALVNVRKPKATVSNGLTIQIGKFAFLLSGLYVETDGTETITVPGTTSGYYKKVWILAAYHNYDGIETVDLEYMEGEPSRTLEGASDPNYLGNGTSPREGGLYYTTPLFEVVIYGGTVYGTPTTLIESLYGIRHLTKRVEAAETEVAKLADIVRTSTRITVNNAVTFIKSVTFSASATFNGLLKATGNTELNTANVKGVLTAEDAINALKRLVVRSGTKMSSTELYNSDSDTVVSGIPKFSYAAIAIRDKDDRHKAAARLYSDGRKGMYYKGQFYPDRYIQSGTATFASNRADKVVGTVTIEKHDLTITVPAQKIEIPAQSITVDSKKVTIPKQEVTIPKQEVTKTIAEKKYDSVDKRGVTVTKTVTFNTPYTNVPKVLAMAHGSNAGVRGITVTDVTKKDFKLNVCCDVNAESEVDWIAVGMVND